MSQMDAFDAARVAARAADDKLGQNILVVDVRRESSLVDCFVLVTGMTHLHIGAIEDAVRESLRLGGARLVRTDGQRGHMWRALDYGNLLVHIMDQKTRDFYAIEKLWERGRPLSWKAEAPKKKSTATKPRRKSGARPRPRASKKRTSKR